MDPNVGCRVIQTNQKGSTACLTLTRVDIQEFRHMDWHATQTNTHVSITLGQKRIEKEGGEK